VVERIRPANAGTGATKMTHGDRFARLRRVLSSGCAGLSARRPLAWGLVSVCLISALYIPTLWTRFDFIDDGNLVYPSAPVPLDQRVLLAWDKVVANYKHLGPFRPVLWSHWELQAELLGADAFRWRFVRLLWFGLATGVLLWLLLELGIRFGPAVFVAALAMWNPYRGEVWTSLTLSEGVAMPYALLALVCAVRAARSPRAWPWDLVGALSLCAALGCKNTFAALVPAQLLLRVASNGEPLRSGWKHHGRRASLLALTLLIPIGHYIFFTANWQPGQYETGGPSWTQFGGMLRAVKGAVGVDFIGPGLAVAALAVLMNGAGNASLRENTGRQQVLSLLRRARAPSRMLWERHRAVLLAGFLLFIFGIAIYLPIGAVSARYSMPAVWGADLWIAALISTLAEGKATFWKRTACAILAAGLVAVAVANLGKQDKFAGRAVVLWQVLEFVERQANPHVTIGWVEGPELNIEEGIHFAWHLHARGRRDVSIRLLGPSGQPVRRVELPSVDLQPTLLVTGGGLPPVAGEWSILRNFSVTYWSGMRRYVCGLWIAKGSASKATDVHIDRPEAVVASR
jgi:hypothetical protein